MIYLSILVKKYRVCWCSRNLWTSFTRNSRKIVKEKIVFITIWITVQVWMLMKVLTRIYLLRRMMRN